jgi:hypothetical protein
VGSGRSLSVRFRHPALPDPSLRVTPDALEGLSRAELVALVLAQAALIEQLLVEVTMLRAEVVPLKTEVTVLKAKRRRTRGTRRSRRRVTRRLNVNVSRNASGSS